MTKKELGDKFWRELGPIRRRLVGRSKFDKLFDAAVSRAPLVHLKCFKGGKSREVLKKHWEDQVSASDVTFGPLFWILISPVIQYIIGRLIEWWFDDPANMTAMEGWKNDERE